MTKLTTFEILDEKHKNSFVNVIDWENNFKSLECGRHERRARLNLSTGKRGSAVSVSACCDAFFRQIVAKKVLNA